MAKEIELYEPIKRILQEKFGKLGECYIEITSKKIGNTIKSKLDDNLLFFLNAEKIYPDLTGYVVESGTSNLIVAEVKSEKIKVRDIYQIKMYSELFHSKYTFLISSEPLSEEIRRYLKMTPAILSYSAGYKRLIIAQFDVRNNQLLEEDL